MVKDDYGVEYMAGGSWSFALGMIAWSIVIALGLAQLIGIDVIGMVKNVC